MYVISGQEMATGHWTFSNHFKQMSDHFELISHTQYIYMTDQKSLMSKRILDLISCSVICM